MKLHKSCLIAAFVVLGCSEKVPTVPCAVVDGVPLTLSEVRCVLRVEARMQELSGSAIKPDQLSRWSRNRSSVLIPQMVNEILIENEIRRLGERPEACDEDKVFNEFNQASGGKAKDRAELEKMFRPDESILSARLDRFARIRAYERRHWRVEPSEAEVRSFCVSMSNLAMQAEIINKDARARASVAASKLAAGESWRKVALEYSEDKLVNPENGKYAEEWMWVGKDGFGYPELAVALKELNVGSYSKPIDTLEGLMIVKLLEKQQERYRLARILFRMSQEIKLPTHDSAVAILRQNKVEALRMNGVNALRGAAKLEYPMGLGVLCDLSKESEK